MAVQAAHEGSQFAVAGSWQPSGNGVASCELLAARLALWLLLLAVAVPFAVRVGVVGVGVSRCVGVGVGGWWLWLVVGGWWAHLFALCCVNSRSRLCF